jgi:hypothetical protein
MNHDRQHGAAFSFGGLVLRWWRDDDDPVIVILSRSARLRVAVRLLKVSDSSSQEYFLDRTKTHLTIEYCAS